MPVEAKPLFRPDVLHPHLKGFALPDRVAAARPKLAHWAEMLSSGRADRFKEQELLPDFLTDVFCDLLGYVRAVDGKDRWTISREKHVQVDGKFADAALGDFRPGKERFIVAVEGKGPKDPLDRPFAGRKMSAVDQGYRYAINLPCDWIVVTSIRQTRLYHKGSDQQTFEAFDTERLASDEHQLRKFVFLLGAERVSPPSGECHFAELMAASERVGRELTKEFYLRYADIRERAFQHLRRENPDEPPTEVLAATQKLLDRILFCAFCEDRSLLPADTIRRAYEHADPYNPRPVWENFRGLFRSINAGNARLGIPAYNGGLFADDPLLDGLRVPDDVCGYFRDLAAYDYRPAFELASDGGAQAGQKLVDVDILGHIFEQSISDLERLHQELEGLAETQDLEKHTARRKKEGAFYTPAFVTRYIMEQALGGVLSDRFEQLRVRHLAKAKGTAKQALADPNAYDPVALNQPQREALTLFWEDWQEELKGIRIVDPACGSGAFLIEAFEQLHAQFQRSNDRLEELRGQRSLFDLDRQILQHNLYGVDLNGEAVEICRLSLWIKTAQRGKALTSLDHNIREGNSVVDDATVHPKALDWRAAFPEAFERGGFDVVVGNPPYVRQEWITPYKQYLQRAYRVYHGAADLYVYFYELGLRLLRPGGRMSYVVTNKWMKAGYGEPLRKYFATESWVESLVDFGHAKQIFPDADVFPSIIVVRRPNDEPPPAMVKACSIPREQLRISDLSVQIEQEGNSIDRKRLAVDAWSLESRGVGELIAKLRRSGLRLAEHIGARPLSGIKTGFNEAFLVDDATRKRLVADDPRCEEIIKPYLRGQDISRWRSGWDGLWMIAIASSSDRRWPWAESGPEAEDVFRRTFPSIHQHLKAFECPLIKRQDKGRFWWELRPCAYWGRFERPKIVYQEIQFHSSYAFDREGTLNNNKVLFLPSDDLYLLGVLNSPIMWWYCWRYLPHMKDEALSPAAYLMESLPIAAPTDAVRSGVEAAVARLVDVTGRNQATNRDVLDWLRAEFDVLKPSMRLRSAIDFQNSDELVDEVRKVRGRTRPLSVAGVRSLRQEYEAVIGPARALASETVGLERKVGDLVNSAYGLTADEVQLMWDTAPPRMPTPHLGGSRLP